MRMGLGGINIRFFVFVGGLLVSGLLSWAAAMPLKTTKQKRAGVQHACPQVIAENAS